MNKIFLFYIIFLVTSISYSYPSGYNATTGSKVRVPIVVEIATIDVGRLYKPANIIEGEIKISPSSTNSLKEMVAGSINRIIKNLTILLKKLLIIPILIGVIAIIFFILFLLLVFALYRKIKRGVLKLISTQKTKIEKPKIQKDLINIKSAYGYEGAKIIYKIKVENNTSEPVGDLKISLFVPEVFLAKEKEKNISMLEAGESKTVTFEIRPTGECGECYISGSLNYYNYQDKKRKEIEIPIKKISIVCPILRIKEINEYNWRNVVSKLIKAEETTKELSIPAENLFNIASRVIKDMNLFMLNPDITKTPLLFNGFARFYGEGVTGLKYAAQLEVIGGSKKSKLILKAYAEKEEALTGFYHKILDELEKRINVKEYIEDSIVQYNITTIRDSVIQRSKIGLQDKNENK
ncbi:MAG: hypothetical protein ACE5J3_10550 [Methanosarcinales archaeon]